MSRSVPDLRYAVIGESEGEPVLYHMNQTAAQAARLRQWREERIGTPCYVVAMVEWHADPLRALRRAQGMGQEGG